MMGAILPDEVTVIEGPNPIAGAHLLPEEAAALGRVSQTRRSEFTAARTYARHALARIGLPPVPILPGPDRQPLWPEGIVGSITHCQNYCAVAVARSDTIRAIGIDAEPDEQLPDEVLAHITVDQERAWLAATPHSTVHWDRILFSAKESVFKAWFSGTRQWLDFTDAFVTVDPEWHRFHVQIHPPFPLLAEGLSTELTGHYSVAGGRILTSLVIEHNKS